MNILLRHKGVDGDLRGSWGNPRGSRGTLGVEGGPKGTKGDLKGSRDDMRGSRGDLRGRGGPKGVLGDLRGSMGEIRGSREVEGGPRGNLRAIEMM